MTGIDLFGESSIGPPCSYRLDSAQPPGLVWKSQLLCKGSNTEPSRFHCQSVTSSPPSLPPPGSNHLSLFWITAIGSFLFPLWSHPTPSLHRSSPAEILSLVRHHTQKTIQAPQPMTPTSILAYSLSSPGVLCTLVCHTGLLCAPLCSHHFPASGPPQ